jgi:hypothetical protein
MPTSCIELFVVEPLGSDPTIERRGPAQPFAQRPGGAAQPLIAIVALATFQFDVPGE